MTPLHPLPPMEQLAREYASNPSYAVWGRRYGCSPSTIRNRLKAWAEQTGRSWPLVPATAKRNQNRDIVDADLARKEIVNTCKQFRITQVTLARLAGLNENLLHKITSGHQLRIFRSTQGKILEACSQLYAGEVVLAPQTVVLPMQVRDRCPNNHPYTGQRDSKGRRLCRVCRAYKDARRTAKAAS